MEGGGTPPPPQCYNEIKKPSAYRVNANLMFILFYGFPRMALFSNNILYIFQQNPYYAFQNISEYIYI